MSETCRLCGREGLVSVLDLGASPPCELFLTRAQLSLPEVTYPLHLRVCPGCLLLQIPALIRPEDTFVDYAYFSSFSDSWVEHARSFVETAVEKLRLTEESFVVEVASNDGYLLQHVVAAGVPCLGIEPSINVSEKARARNVPTRTDFLNEEVADAVVTENGLASLVVANNVYAHVPDLLGFTRALRLLVADDGYVTVEVHHALNLVTQAQFDTIYHEHFQYYTVISAQRALATAGLVLVDVERLPTHGGSLRLWAQPRETEPQILPSVAIVIEEEQAAGLDSVHGYLGLAQRVAKLRSDLVSFLIECVERGKSVAGYGAPGKGNTLLNYCGIRPDLLPFTVDRNPYKHGRFTPGMRIPVLSPEVLGAERPDVIVVLPWNLRRELTEQLAWTAEWGATLAFPLPKLETVEAGVLGVYR